MKQVRSNKDIFPSATLSSKYGHLNNQDGDGHDPSLTTIHHQTMGDVTVGLSREKNQKWWFRSFAVETRMACQ